MNCKGCELRAKLMREAWEAARVGDLDTYHEKMRAMSKSIFDDLVSGPLRRVVSFSEDK